MKKQILVIGATGLIGQAVAKQLNEDGYNVIVMSRSREKAKKIFSKNFEIVEADVLNAESIQYSFQGVDGVYINLPERDVPVAMPNILKCANDVGVEQVIYSSGCTVCKENAWHPMIKGHYEGERFLVESGIPYTIFKLTMVMDMIPRYANNGKPFILGKQKHGWSWIHSNDIAKMASKAFRKEAAKNKKLTIFGTDKTTIAGAVDQYNHIFHPEAKAAKPKPYWLANLIALFVGSSLKYAISIFKYFECHPESGNPALTYELLGKPQTSIKSYLESLKHGMA